jgi:hypothetical protein
MGKWENGKISIFPTYFVIFPQNSQNQQERFYQICGKLSG